MSNELVLDAADRLISLLELDICGCIDVCRCGYMKVKKARDALLAVFANHQDAPDGAALVAPLVAALDDIGNLTISPCWSGSEHRLSAAKAVALAAISTYREQGGTGRE